MVRLQRGRQLDDELAGLLVVEPFEDEPELAADPDPDPDDAEEEGVELVDELPLDPESLEAVLLSDDFLSPEEDSLDVDAVPPSLVADVELELLDDPLRLSVL